MDCCYFYNEFSLFHFSIIPNLIKCGIILQINFKFTAYVNLPIDYFGFTFDAQF